MNFNSKKKCLPPSATVIESKRLPKECSRLAPQLVARKRGHFGAERRVAQHLVARAARVGQADVAVRVLIEKRRQVGRIDVPT